MKWVKLIEMPRVVITYEQFKNIVHRNVSFFGKTSSCFCIQGSGAPRKRTKFFHAPQEILYQKPKTSIRHLSQQVELFLLEYVINFQEMIPSVLTSCPIRSKITTSMITPEDYGFGSDMYVTLQKTKKFFKELICGRSLVLPT